MKTQTPSLIQICTNLQEQMIKGDLRAMQEFIDESVSLYNEGALPLINMVLSKPSNLKLLISKILNCRAEFEAVRANSYCHENGFHKIVMLQGKNFKLRLHHFGATSKAAMENVHDHRWPFASSILKGNLHMEMFEVADVPENTELLLHHVYHADKSSGAYQAHLEGVAALKRVKKVSFSEGTTYLLMPDALHRIVNDDQQESITMILTGKPVSSTCNLYARRPLTAEEKQTPCYTSEVLRAQLNLISELIYPQHN
jgi:hypothetical protein